MHDGIRAVSILIVIGFHLGFLGFGWAGVQIFFVLSGYLITGILVADREHYSLTPYLKRFYWRRSLRIFPLYYGYLAVVALVHYYFAAAREVSGSWLPLFWYTMDSPACVGRVVYVSPFSQLDAFAAGAAIAILPWSSIRHPRRWFVAALATLVLLGVWNFAHIDRTEISISTLSYPVHSTSNFQHVWGYRPLPDRI
jgi:peptidoglycan/LPS O-acetylase OafA/YrhL